MTRLECDTFATQENSHSATVATLVSTIIAFVATAESSFFSKVL